VTQAGKVAGKLLTLGEILVLQGAAFTQAKQKPLAFGPCKFQSPHAQADLAVTGWQPFDSIESGEPFERLTMNSGRMAANIQARIEVTGVAQIELRRMILLVIREKGILRVCVVQMPDAHRRGALLTGREKYHQAANRSTTFSLTQVIQPDEPEAENAGGIQSAGGAAIVASPALLRFNSARG
jgi:hypothetical protein